MRWWFTRALRIERAAGTAIHYNNHLYKTGLVRIRVLHSMNRCRVGSLDLSYSNGRSSCIPYVSSSISLWADTR